MPDTFEIENGLLRWRDQSLAINFSLHISPLGEVEIDLRPRQDKPPSFGELIVLFQKLKRGEGDRSVPNFHLSGRTESGMEVSTEYAYLCDLSFNSGQGPVIRKSTASAGEINLSFQQDSEIAGGQEVIVKYLSRGQVGGPCGPVETKVGSLSYSATWKVQEASEKFGQITIERGMPADLPVWLAECDDLVHRVLEIFSLAQGRWLEPIARNLYVDGKRVAQRLRPRDLREQRIAHLLHHLDPESILRLAIESYTPNLASDTGLRVALFWMLADASYTEHRMLHFAIALEALVSSFEAKSSGVVEKATFRSTVKPALSAALETLVAEGGIDRPSANILKDRIASINSPTFFEKVQQLIAYYGVPVDDLNDDLRKVIVDCRNDLVHRGLLAQYEKGKAELHRLSDVTEELLKRMMLAILRYEGQYISALYNLDAFFFERDKRDGSYCIRPAAASSGVLARGIPQNPALHQTADGAGEGRYRHAG